MGFGGATCPALELEGVERLAGRFDADAVESLAVGVEQGQREEEGLHRGLQTEGHVALRCRSHVAVGQSERDRAQVGVGIRELRDAVVDAAAPVGQNAGAEALEVVRTRIGGGCHAPSLSGGGAVRVSRC
jgi:hypothetical protein